MFGRSDVLEMMGEWVAGVPGLQFVVDASETHFRPVIPLALSESDCSLMIMNSILGTPIPVCLVL